MGLTFGWEMGLVLEVLHTQTENVVTHTTLVHTVVKSLRASPCSQHDIPVPWLPLRTTSHETNALLPLAGEKSQEEFEINRCLL
jgi:hypothetical protein